MENSQGDIDHLLRILAARDVLHGHHDTPPIFENAEDMYATIDSIPYGQSEWTSVAFCYTGPIDGNTPKWKTRKYVLHTRNILQAVECMAQSADFVNTFDYVPREEYILKPSGEYEQRFCNMMSGQWAYKKAVSPSRSDIRRHTP